MIDALYNCELFSFKCDQNNYDSKLVIKKLVCMACKQNSVENKYVGAGVGGNILF